MSSQIKFIIHTHIKQQEGPSASLNIISNNYPQKFCVRCACSWIRRLVRTIDFDWL